MRYLLVLKLISATIPLGFFPDEEGCVNAGNLLIEQIAKAGATTGYLKRITTECWYVTD